MRIGSFILSNANQFFKFYISHTVTYTYIEQETRQSRCYPRKIPQRHLMFPTMMHKQWTYITASYLVWLVGKHMPTTCKYTVKTLFPPPTCNVSIQMNSIIIIRARPGVGLMCVAAMWPALQMNITATLTSANIRTTRSCFGSQSSSSCRCGPRAPSVYLSDNLLQSFFPIGCSYGL